MMRLRSSPLLGLLVAASGCSLLYDTDPYRHGSPAGTPTRPEVVVSPTSPTTLDDLTATITVESTSSVGVVAYRYAWTCAPSCGTAEGSTVPAASTTKNQTWTVRVTPFVDTIEGPVAEASTTVVNSPPTIGYAAFERYDVWPDDIVRAFVGRTFDADGDTIATSYAWTVDGVVQSSVVDRLDFSSAPANEGAEVRVVATVADAAGPGGSSSAGPAVVRPAGGWRPLEPNHAEYYVGIPLFADAERERVLALVDGSLWEYRMGDTRRGWARLGAGTNLPQIWGGTSVYDAAGDRFFLFGGMDYTDGTPEATDALYEIAVPHAGGETFRAVPVVGTRPTPRVYTSSLADPTRQRALIYGGGVPSTIVVTWDSVSDELWELDFASADPTFTLLGTGLAPGGLMGGAMVLDPTGDAAFLLGGAYPLPTLQLSANVFRIDLTTDTFDAQVVAQLPQARSSMQVVATADEQVAYVFGGTTSAAGQVPTDLLRFDLAARTFTPVTTTEALPATNDPAVTLRVDGHFRLATNARLDGGFATYDVDPAGAVTRLAERGITSPGSTNGASVIIEEGPSGRPIVVFGSRPSGTPPTTATTAFAWDAGAWVPAPTLAGPTFSRHDAMPLFAIGNGRSGLFGGRKYVAGVLSFLFDDLDTTNMPALWTTSRPAPVPVPIGFPNTIDDGVAWDAGCSFGFYESSDATLWRRAGATYEALAFSAARPGQRDRAQFVGLTAGANTRALMFSGIAGGVATTDTWLIDVCHSLPLGAPEEGFIAPTVNGTVPAGRANARLVPVRPVAGGLGHRAILFGGSTTASGTTFVDGIAMVELDSSDVVTWTSLPASADTPTSRIRHAAFWDRALQRLIVVGGEGPPQTNFGPTNGTRTLTDTWEYRLPPGI